MSLWGLLALFYIILAAASGGSAWFFLTHVLPGVVTGPDYIYLSWVVIGLVSLVLVCVAALFIALGRLIARPLHGLVAAMQAFAVSGTHTAIPVPHGAPHEMRALVGAFADMAQRIDTAHSHDAEISRVKSDFISTAAHQLRTPLTAIRWAIEALQKSGLTPDQTALVDNAVAKSKELVAIVGTLLDISSIESGKYQYKFAGVDLAKLAEGVARDFGHLANEKQVSLFFANDGKPVPPVRADEERITWILNNLVENAVRYTPAGGSVRVTLEASGDRVYLRVRDTGIGIPANERGNIFERFYRAGNAIAKENEGNGLGLYIARQIAVDHGGDLSFAANPEGPGTTFTLSIPVMH